MQELERDCFQATEHGHESSSSGEASAKAVSREHGPSTSVPPCVASVGEIQDYIGTLADLFRYERDALACRKPQCYKASSQMA